MGITLLSLSSEGKVPFFKLKLKIWASGKLISIATDFSSFMDIPSMSVLVLDWKALMMSTISPGLVRENSRRGALSAFRKFSGSVRVLLMESEIFLPAVVKNLLNSLGICLRSSTDLSETDNLSIFGLAGSDPMASLMRSQVFFRIFSSFLEIGVKIEFSTSPKCFSVYITEISVVSNIRLRGLIY